MGRWSNLVAIRFLEWLSPNCDLIWLDVGCGSGALSETILNKYKPKNLVSIDQSSEFVQFAQKRLGDRATCRIGNALNLPVDNTSNDLTVSGLVLNFIHDVNKALLEMKRVTKNQGEVAIYIWDYAGKMDFLRIFWEAAIELNSDALSLSESNRFEEFNIDAITDEFQKVGFQNVEAKKLEITTTFMNFHDYWQPFLGGQGPAPSYLKSLANVDKEHLKNKIYKRLPIQSNGAIPLVAEAIAVKGIVFK